MTAVTVDCSGVASEADFWNRYLEAIRATGTGEEFFGRNLDAFWDAVEGGGPGWPGDVELVFKNAASLAPLRDGDFLAALEGIASKLRTASITIIP